MPGSTTNRGYPYPLGPEQAVGATDIQALGEAVDADVTANIVQKAGDTMIGPLTLSEFPLAAMQAACMKYVDDRERAYVVEDPSLSWNAAIAPGPWPKLMLGTQPDGPSSGSAYFYLTNYIYSGGEMQDLTGPHTRNMSQLAIGYTGNKIALRNRYSGVWTAWVYCTMGATALDADALKAEIDGLRSEVASLRAQIAGGG